MFRVTLTVLIFNLFFNETLMSKVDVEQIDETFNHTDSNIKKYDKTDGHTLQEVSETENKNEKLTEVPTHIYTKQMQLPCSCTNSVCSCCAILDLDPFNFHQRACLNISYDPSELALNVDVLLNGVSFYHAQLSGRNPPPFCTPIPQLPIVMICVRLYNIEITRGSVKTCVNLEARVARSPVLVVSFDCVRVGNSGIALEKPSINPAKPPAVFPNVQPVLYSLPTGNSSEPAVTFPDTPVVEIELDQ